MSSKNMEAPESGTVTVSKADLDLECPVCLETPKSPPVYQCSNGHIHCQPCRPKLKECPICRIKLTGKNPIRNLAVEKIIEKFNIKSRRPETDTEETPSKRLKREEIPENRREIWTGGLSWKPPNAQWIQRLNGQIQSTTRCTITYEQGKDIPFDSENWPHNLIMQLVPKSLLQEKELSKYVGNSTPCVSFHLCDDSLTRIISQGYWGCVHIQSGGRCNTKVIILLYSTEKKSFLGFIPNEQFQFVNAIRGVITKEKARQRAEQLQNAMPL